MPAFLLSGFLFEINSMPRAIQWLTLDRAGALPDSEPSDGVSRGDIWPLFLPAIAAMLASAPCSCSARRARPENGSPEMWTRLTA